MGEGEEVLGTSLGRVWKTSTPPVVFGNQNGRPSNDEGTPPL